MHLLDRANILAFGASSTLPDREIWLFQRTYLSCLSCGESGSARLKKLSLVDYLVWITFPFTLISPLIRPSEFFSQHTRQPSSALNKVLDQNWYVNLILSIVQLLCGSGLTQVTTAIDHLGPHWPKFFDTLRRRSLEYVPVERAFFHLMECLALFW
jgi:hypothetical protein